MKITISEQKQHTDIGIWDPHTSGVTIWSTIIFWSYLIIIVCSCIAVMYDRLDTPGIPLFEF